MVDYSLNQCFKCGIQLAPDDFDAVCSSCDKKQTKGKKPEKPPVETKYVRVQFDIEINTNASDMDLLAWLKFELSQDAVLSTKNPLISKPLIALPNSVAILPIDKIAG